MDAIANFASQYPDEWVAGVLTVAFTLLRYPFQYLVQVLLARLSQLPASKRLKFSESTWKMVYYTVVWVWSVDIVLRQDFFWNTRLCWVGWPEVPISNSFRLYYMTQLAFYMHSFIAHVTIEVHREDFWAMLIHHIVSSILIGGSYATGYHRIGGVLLCLHDVNDILLEVAKQFKYLDYDWVADPLFALMILCWGVTRAVLFPFKVAYSANYESREMIGEVPGWLLFNSLVMVIQVLNLYWFAIMLRMLYNVVFKREKIHGKLLHTNTDCSDSREKDD